MIQPVLSTKKKVVQQQSHTYLEELKKGLCKKNQILSPIQLTSKKKKNIKLSPINFLTKPRDIA